MRLRYLLYFIVSVFVFTASSCFKSLNSALVVGDSFRTARNEFNYNMNYKSEDSYQLRYRSDTLIILHQNEYRPLDIMCIFQDDICIYQEINVYCAPCADVMIDEILSDSNYKFEQLDAVNWKAKNKEIILRVKDQSDTTKSCTKIIAHKIVESI